MEKYLTPLYLNFFATNRCQLNCAHCFYHRYLNKPINELSLVDIEKIVQSFAYPLEFLLLTGGEPFLRKDLTEICSIFSTINKTKHINFNTNGWNPGLIYNNLKKISQKITNSTGLSVQISIDGLEKTHDKLRKKGSFQNTLKTIKKLKTLKKIDLSIMTTICRRNLREIEKLASLVRSLNLKHKFQFIRDNYNDVFNLDNNWLNDFRPRLKRLVLPFDEFYKANLKVNKFEQDIKQKLKRKIALKNMEKKRRMVECLAGLSYAVLYPDGKVSFCEPLKPFSNIKDFNYNFKSLWQSEKTENMRKKTERCFCADSCAIITSIYHNQKDKNKHA